MITSLRAAVPHTWRQQGRLAGAQGPGRGTIRAAHAASSKVRHLTTACTSATANVQAASAPTRHASSRVPDPTLGFEPLGLDRARVFMCCVTAFYGMVDHSRAHFDRYTKEWAPRARVRMVAYGTWATEPSVISSSGPGETLKGKAKVLK
jgi:hypothetical protein